MSRASKPLPEPTRSLPRRARRAWASSALLAALQGFVLVTDTGLRVRRVHAGSDQRDAHALAGTDAAESVAVRQQALFREAAALVVSTGAPTDLDVQDGATDRWHRVRIAPLLDRGVVSGLALHWLDVDSTKQSETENVRMRATLQAVGGATDLGPESDADYAMRRLELIADALPFLLSYIDSERRYQFTNVAYTRWFGTSREEMRGRSLSEVLGAEAYTRLRAHVDAALAGHPVSYEMTVPYRRAGVRRVVAHYVPDVAPDGTVHGFYALVEDVTPQRDAEAALRQQEHQIYELQKLEALGSLAGGLAHDFNNLLNAITIACDTVLLDAGDRALVARRISAIRRAAERGTSLTAQLLSFSRRSALDAAPVALDALLADMQILLEHLLAPRARLTLELDAKCWVRADPGQIQQVIMNLAINARDAMPPEGGHVRIHTARMDMPACGARAHGAVPPGTYVRIRVTDTGHGMDEATQARIFEPLFTTKPPGQGTGLGLSTVHGIVRRAHGHVTVESAPNEGTALNVYLPRMDTPGGI